MLKLCDDIDTLSMMLCDGELAAQELRDVELHLIDCPACRAHVDRDRGFLGELRHKLAPPPTPELLRARLGRALDSVDRSRRPSWRALTLPAVAALAAAAALVLFVTVGDSRQAPKAAASRPRAMAQPERHVDSPGRPGTLALPELTIQWSGTERLGQDVAALSYVLVTPAGDRFAVYATVHDASRLRVDAQARSLVGGYDVWAIDGGVVVRDGPRAIRLSSPELGLQDLRRIIGGTALVARIGADDPRR